VKAYYRIISKSVNIIFKYVFGLKIIGRENLQDVFSQRCIIASNHMSNFDPPLIGSTMPIAIHFMAKEELFKFKPFGWVISKFNATPVRRGVVDKRALTNINKILNNDETIVIFPEGSRKSFTAKPGIGMLAMNTKSSILPIYLENSNHLLKCLFRIKRLKIYIGKPLTPDFYQDLEVNKESYRDLSRSILDIINGLKDGNKIS